MQLTNLYISPHYDDAVFSCAGKILEDVERGIRVIVVTVFSESNNEGSDDYKKRSLENDEALTILGAEGVKLGYLDAPFRQSFYDSFRQLILERHPQDDSTFVKHIGGALNELCERVNPENIYAPLGVGTHIDHRLTFEAANRHLDRPVTYYEDRPYAFTLHAVRSRLHELGVRAQSVDHDSRGIKKSEIKEHLNSLSLMTYVQKYLPAGATRDQCYELILTKMEMKHKLNSKGVRKIKSYPPTYSRLATKAAFTYKSQVENILGSIDMLEKQIKIYSRSLTTSPNYAEQYWVLTPSSNSTP